MKRIIDCIIAALCLVIFSPVCLVIALAIRMEDGLPVIYKQERIGLHGKPFFIYKFRSMRVDAEKDGPERMMWAVKLLQENFDNVPLALDTANKKAIEAGIKVYNRTNGKPIVNSADAGSRISNIDLAAANDAICIALCSADGIAKDNEERMMHCHHMLERGLSLGMEATDLWFDPLFLVVKGMQDKQMDVLNAIKLFSDEGLKSTGGLSNNSNGAPKNVRPIMDSALVAMAMMQGLTSAIVNPNDLRLMETIKSCDIFKNNELYSDSYLDA